MLDKVRAGVGVRVAKRLQRLDRLFGLLAESRSWSRIVACLDQPRRAALVEHRVHDRRGVRLGGRVVQQRAEWARRLASTWLRWPNTNAHGISSSSPVISVGRRRPGTRTDTGRSRSGAGRRAAGRCGRSHPGWPAQRRAGLLGAAGATPPRRRVAQRPGLTTWAHTTASLARVWLELDPATLRA
jgi:hypothetical protein